jgi:hypothetical protein
MAKYTVAAGQVGAHDKTLAANVVDSVSFEDADHFGYAEVLSDGTAAIYVSVDGTDPTVSGSNTYIVPAIASARVVPVGEKPVKLISAGTPTYSVAKASA